MADRRSVVWQSRQFLYVGSTVEWASCNGRFLTEVGYAARCRRAWLLPKVNSEVQYLSISHERVSAFIESVSQPCHCFVKHWQVRILVIRLLSFEAPRRCRLCDRECRPTEFTAAWVQLIFWRGLWIRVRLRRPGPEWTKWICSSKK